MHTPSGIARSSLGCGVLAGLALLLFSGAALPAFAQQDADAVPLDRLLKLPDSYGAGDGERRAGATAPEWRERFGQARAEVEKAGKDLEKSQTDLESAADDGAGWQAGAPLGGPVDPENNTVSYKLRQQIRDRREQLEVAQRKLLDLQVEADLAGVPDSWRE